MLQIGYGGQVPVPHGRETLQNPARFSCKGGSHKGGFQTTRNAPLKAEELLGADKSRRTCVTEGCEGPPQDPNPRRPRTRTSDLTPGLLKNLPLSHTGRLLLVLKELSEALLNQHKFCLLNKFL